MPTVLVSLVALLAVCLAEAEGGRPEVLRVCADPDNRPFSNQKLEGFENKIAELIARDLGAKLSYTWWPHQRGLVRRTLEAGRCDVLIGIPTGYERVLSTRPYYRTSYVIAYPKGRGLKVASLDDPALRRLKIGVHINTPPAEALAQRGLAGDNLIGYPLFYDSQFHPEDYPGKVIEDLIAGKIDVAIVWGPIAGYFVRAGSPPILELVPVHGDSPGLSFSFSVSMGVRKDDLELKGLLEEALDRNRAEITRILADYGVPLLGEGSGSN
jgi:mxaJ protein